MKTSSLLPLLRLCLALMLTLTLCAACRSASREIVRERVSYQHDTLRLTTLVRDTLRLTDSVTLTVIERAGSLYVYRDRVRSELGSRLRLDTLWRVKSDTVRITASPAASAAGSASAHLHRTTLTKLLLSLAGLALLAYVYYIKRKRE